MIPLKYRTQLITAVIIFFLLGMIWFGHSNFLYTNRIHLTSILFLLWISKFILFDLTYTQKKSHANDSKLQALRGRFEGAIQFLKKTVIARHGTPVNLSVLPWLLMIGPAGSGKTSLLAQSDIPFVLSKRFKNDFLEKIPTSETCDWWATKDLVMVDIPGSWFLPRKKSNHLWQQFLSLIKKPQVRNQLSGIVIVLHLPELMKIHNNENKDAILLPIKKQITELRAALNTQLPFHLVITKTDLLPGFGDFFRENSREERNQAWGITLPTPHSDENITDIFSHRFNALIKRVNEQLTWRLHQEKNLLARGRIKDFPLQLEKLKDLIADTLKIFDIPGTQAAGVWLTSAMQDAPENTIIDASFSTQLIPTTSALLMTTPEHTSKSFFIRQLILQSLPTPHARIISQSAHSRYRDAAYALSGGLFIASIIVFGHDFIISEKHILEVKNSLTHYEQLAEKSNQENPTIAPTLPLLDALETTESQNSHRALIDRVVSFYTDHSHNHIHQLYQRALQSIFLPSLETSLDTYLKTADRTRSDLLYQVLAARLMLSGDIAYQPNTMAHALDQLSPTPLDQERMIHHLDSVMSNHWFSSKPDPSLIRFVRQQLTQLPTTDLAMIVLENETLNLPNLTNESNTKIILNEAIPAAVNAALTGNTVLGKIPLQNDQPSTELLTTQLRSRYLVSHKSPLDLTQENNLSMNESFNSANFLHQDFLTKHQGSQRPTDPQYPNFHLLQ